MRGVNFSLSAVNLCQTADPTRCYVGAEELYDLGTRVGCCFFVASCDNT